LRSSTDDLPSCCGDATIVLLQARAEVGPGRDSVTGKLPGNRCNRFSFRDKDEKQGSAAQSRPWHQS
jgi:hypothetical protein